MRQFLRHETVLSVFSLFLIGHLLFSPVLSDIQAAENSAPVISCFPVRVGRFGRPLTIRVHAMSDNEIAKVTLVVQNDDKPLRGQMPRLAFNDVPVQVHAIKSAKIYSGPSERKRVKGMVRLGQVLYVSMENEKFYRVMSDTGVRGFILKSDVDVLKTGNAYAVTLPASVTSRSVLTYAVEAVDSKGAKTVTEQISMRLLTEEEINGFIAENSGKGKTRDGKSGNNKMLLWGGVAAVAAGGAYYMMSSKNGDSDQAAVQVLVEWE